MSSRKEEKKNRDKQKYLVFKLDNDRYSVPILEVREIIAHTEVTPLPNSSNYVRGLLNLRGQIITVFDLRKKFGLPKRSPIPMLDSIIVSQIDDLIVAFTVDEVLSVDSISLENICPSDNEDAGALKKQITGIIKNEENNTLTMLLSFKTILDEHAYQNILQIQQNKSLLQGDIAS